MINLPMSVWDAKGKGLNKLLQELCEEVEQIDGLECYQVDAKNAIANLILKHRMEVLKECLRVVQSQRGMGRDYTEGVDSCVEMIQRLIHTEDNNTK